MEYERERKKLVNSLRKYNISERTLKAMNKVPRHLFVPSIQIANAYVDHPLPIGYAQTISAPHMVAMMCDLLDLHEGLKLLEIGAGSGYNAAVMAEIMGKKGEIYSIERLEKLAVFARDNLKKAGYSNVEIINGDGSLGLPEHAPYDRICVTASAPCTPVPLVEQLKPGGIMVIPEGKSYQRLYLIKKDMDGNIIKEDRGGVIFVPLVGNHGFNMLCGDR
ncbi:protein-L-isoaspartate(D-aspartate) O-methyltransferase [Methanolobus vulcani]|jgi:protein-L-isoaspartate(D-aspartate) O-methyltransferase|uniref:Protein-L-isoaspartate O-methyltransferase n=1 Tax=Methanolobus vulcani TaxID=38026 RepID=A0A7Z7AXX6_9EURY|nr:protein-L-isoaspartate O-methyltransferase [Methanolobus vulcani]MDK2824937.1 protein-L-isoaspartate(D-aspartate) O-methyltransferase [Methanolobus sp.]MDK2947239.1 protein-L-isoaspartate(D-aspartate) O-methyltransferase [Methanolobus sp.]SDG11427.1 protein-L-isoaspartate(D-aspartate) O-methyltransferase [Methanolobus vulcani]